MSKAGSNLRLKRGQGAGLRIVLVQALFNEKFTSKLLMFSRRSLLALGVRSRDLQQIQVPGALELPLAAKELAATGRFDAVVCLGAVLRGETSHFDLVCQGALQGIVRAGLDTGVPVIFGVVACDTEAQAMARCAGRQGNVGVHAAETAVHMAALLARVRHGN